MRLWPAGDSGIIFMRATTRAPKRRSNALKKGDGLAMGATSTVVVYIVAGGITSVIGMVVSAWVFSFLVLPRVVKHSRWSHIRFWTPWFFASLSLRETNDAKRIRGRDRQ